MTKPIRKYRRIKETKFVSEHEHLTKVLRDGTPADRKREAASQAKELKERK
jgi:hypothetical protein